MFSLLQVVSHDLSHIHHTPAEDHPTKVAIMWFSHLVVVNTQKKTLASHIPRMSRMVLAGIMGLDLLPVSNFPASFGEFSKPIPTKHHPIPKSPNETLV